MPKHSHRQRLRWIVYPLLGLVAVAGVGLTLWVRSDAARSMLRDRIATAAALAIGRPVEVGAVDFTILPPGFTIAGLRSAPPTLGAARVEGTFSLRALLQAQLVVTDLDVHEPILEWDADEAGLITPSSERPEGTGRFTLERLRLHGGTVVIGSSRRLISADLRGIRAQAVNANRASGSGAKGPWEGAVSFDASTVTIDTLSLSGIRGSLAIEADTQTARVHRATLRAEGALIRAEGLLQWGRPVRGRFEIASVLDPSSPALRRPLPQLSARSASLDLLLHLPGDAFGLTGSFDLDQPAIDLDKEKAADGPLRPWHGQSAHGRIDIKDGLTSVTARLEGIAGGALDIDYTSDPATGRTVHLVAADPLEIGAMLEPIDLPGEPLVFPDTALTGQATLRWPSLPGSVLAGTAAIELAPREGALPLSGSVELALEGDQTTIHTATFEMPGARLSVAGRVDPSASESMLSLGVNLEATEVTPLASFLKRRFPQTEGSSAPRPTDLAGAISFSGSIEGSPASPSLDGRFSSAGATLSFLPLPISHMDGAIRLRDAIVSLDFHSLVGEGLAAKGSVRVDTRKGHLLAAALDPSDVPASLLATLAGLSLQESTPTGAVRASGQIKDLGAGLEGFFELSADVITLSQLPLHDLSAEGRLTPQSLLLDKVSLTLLSGSVHAEGTIPLKGEGPGGITLTATGVDLGEAQAVLGGPALAGIFSATGTLSPGAHPSLSLDLSGEEVEASGISLGRITGSLKGPINRLQLTLVDEPGALRAIADLGADVEEGDEAIMLDATVTASDFRLEQLLPLFPEGALAGLRGRADGVIHLRFPLGKQEDLQVEARLSRVALAAGNQSLASDGPLRLTMRDGFLTLAPTRLLGAGTDLLIGGSMVVGGAHEVTAIITGRFDLGLAEVAFPDLRASGEGVADLRVIQRMDQITYEGTITASGGILAHPALPLPIQNLAGHARFDEGGVFRVEQAGFLIGGGKVEGSGWARFEGASMPGLHLALLGKGIRAEIFPELNAFFDAETALDRENGAFRFSGHVGILRAVYRRPFGTQASDLLLRTREFAPSATRRTGAPPLFLDLAIDAEEDLWVRNEDALIEAAAHLAIGGTLDEPELSGRISALEGGTYRFRGITYRIVGGSMDFADLTKIDPVMEIEAATRIESYEVTLRVTGRFSRPIYELSSDPALPQRDIVWLLITGHTISESGSEAERGMAEGQVAAYLAAPVAGAVSAPIEKFLGASSVRIDPFFLNGTADPSARVTVTKRVASNLLLTYSSSLGQGGQEIYQLEYNPGRLWDLIGTRDVDGSIGADIQFRRRWRGMEAPGQADPERAEPNAKDGRARIGTLSVTSDHMVDEPGDLLRRLPFAAGGLYRRADLLDGRESLRRIWVAAGFPAARVDISEKERAGAPGQESSLSDISIEVESGPRHELVFAGDDPPRQGRKAVTRAWQEPVLVEELSEVGRRALLAQLKDQGRYGATVEAAVTEPESGLRRVTLTTLAGPKVRVREMRIKGNDHIPSERIARQMLTRPTTLVPLRSRGLLREAVLDEDIAAIRALYLASGYLQARVVAPEITLSPDGTEAIITLEIDEGELSKVGSVSLEGTASGVSPEELLRTAGLSVGQPVSLDAIVVAADKVRETLDAAGYSHARVGWRMEGPASSQRVIFSLTPMERARILSIAIEGNTRTRGRIVEREIALSPGEWFSRSGALATQRNLYRLGVFRSVQVDAEPLADQPGMVNVRIRVQEGSPILTAWGGGYDSQDGARASFEVANNNLFGTRRAAALFLRGSAVDRRAQVTLRDPNLFGEKIETLLSGFIERQELESFGQRRIGAAAQLTRRLADHTTLYGRYRLEDIDLFDLKISAAETGRQTVRLASGALSFSHDTRDDIINPTRGVFTSVDAGVYLRALGSETQFTRVFGSARRFQKFGRSAVVWATSIRAGALTSREIPVSERFFAGGDTTLRGFRFNAVGPADSVTGNPVGGEGLFLINQELRFPIYRAMKGVAFYDAGNVFSTLSDYDLTDLRHVAGFGLRFDTPVGPFRIEYGRKLDHVTAFDALGNPLGRLDESRGQIFFSIGQAF